MGSTVKLIQNIQTIFAFIISLTTVLGIFTAIINKMFSKKLKPIEDRLDNNETQSLEKDMTFWRYHVVSFASELHNGIPKTKYEFEAVFKFVDEYEKAIEKLGIKNSLFKAEEEYIREVYKNMAK